MNRLTCPVCERSQIEENICPNCETDLSTYGMLLRLPRYNSVEAKPKKRVLLFWLPIGIAILFLLLGFGLGFIGNSIIARQEKIIKSPTDVASSISISQLEKDKSILHTKVEIYPQTIESRISACGGFNYTVRRGDSLSSISKSFYGNSSFWSLIAQANPTVSDRENLIKINELLSIPNLKNTCSKQSNL